MGIRLDWQIESDRAAQKVGEDPEQRRLRRRQQLRFLYFVLLVMAFFGAIFGAVWFRLYTIDNTLRSDLITTAQAEAAAIRISDLPTFMSIMRSADPEWLNQQRDRFNRYQDLKTKSDVKLTGNIIDATVDDPRGRVVMEEIVDGVTYHALWYFWRYPDGWRHVPTDYTFWGDDATIKGKYATITYKQLDSGLAQALASRLDNWWQQGCNDLGCGTQNQPLTINIVSDPSAQLRWDEGTATATAGTPAQTAKILTVPSPLASSLDNRVRSDVDITPPLEESIAAQIADQLLDQATGGFHATPLTDAAWIRQSMVDWLAATFVGRVDLTRLNFIQTLYENYHANGLSAVAHGLSANPDISVVAQALHQPLERLAVDWKPFFQWRLDLEKLILTSNATPQQQQSELYQLWNQNDATALNNARNRFSRPTLATPQVQAVTIGPDASGTPTATVQATTAGQAQTLQFVLIGGTWKRTT